MKTIILTATLVGLCLPTYSQTKVRDVDSTVPDTVVLYLRDTVAGYTAKEHANIVNDTTNRNYLSDGAFDYYIDRYFTLINYERETFTDGNSAALKIADDKTTLNLTLSKKFKGSILSVGTGLNIKDNSGTLFTGDDPTAGTQFNIAYSILLKPLRRIHFDDGARDTNYKARFEIVDSLKRLYVLKNPNLLAPLRRKLAKQESLIEAYRKKVDDVNSKPDTLLKYQELMTTALAAKEKILAEMKSVTGGKSGKNLIEEIEKKNSEKTHLKEISSEGVTTVRMVWASMASSYRKDVYKTFEATLPPSSRVGEEPFDGWAFSIGGNYFFQRTSKWIEFAGNRLFNSVYLGVNYSLNRSNSYASIKETAYSIVKSSTSNDTIFQLTSTDKLRNITNVEFTQFFIYRTSVQFTGMMGKKQFVGINLTGNIEDSQKGTTFNSRFGVLFRFIDSADKKAKVNFELFLALDDFNNVNKAEDDNVWDRRTIGISASVPFTKVFFK